MAKLFEFSVLVERLIVVYADDEAHARTWFEDMTALGLSENGDPGKVCDIVLFDSRDGFKDDAHVIGGSWRQLRTAFYENRQSP